MLDRSDVEAAVRRDEANNSYDTLQSETEALLPSSLAEQNSFEPAKGYSVLKSCSQRSFSVWHITAAFVLGAVACVATQFLFCGRNCLGDSGVDRSLSETSTSQDHRNIAPLAPPYVGSTEVHHFPPTKPTNAFPSQFPSNVGYAGGTPTGAEPAVIATAPAYPIQGGQCAQQLIAPETIEGQKPKEGGDDDDRKKKGKHHKSFNLFRSWGNLTPWYSVGRGAFGIDSTPETPDTCVITGLHFLHRHGARYPTAYCKSTFHQFNHGF